MGIHTYPLTVNYNALDRSAVGLSPTLTAVTLDYSKEIGKKRRTAVVLCPGGGYEFCSDREAEPIAMRLAGYGFAAFVLRYSCVRKPFPTALAELATAVAFVRSHADAFDIAPDRIVVCGFSAGAHLAGCLGTLWNADWMHKLYSDTNDCRPNGMILSYPVIKTGKFSHAGSISGIIGPSPEPWLQELVSLERQVTADTPPAFLWHCADDTVVPVQNTLVMLNALSNAGIPYEAHIFPTGGHGLALADDTTAGAPRHLNAQAAEWFPLAVAWLRRLGAAPQGSNV